MGLSTIWKFPLKLEGSQPVAIPDIYSILSAGVDADGELCIWAAVDPTARKIEVEIVIVGTGNPLPHVGDFIGSVTQGYFVWHVFTGPRASSTRQRNANSFHFQTVERS